MKYLLFILLSITFSETIGGYAGSSFRYGTNAREIALGNALISSYNKGFNALVNPALLSEIKSDEYGFSYFSLSLDRSVQVLSLSNTLPPNAGMSLSVHAKRSLNVMFYKGSWEGLDCSSRSRTTAETNTFCSTFGVPVCCFM